MTAAEDHHATPNRRETTRRLLVRALRYRGLIAAALLAAMVAGIAKALPILLPKLFIDHVLMDRPPNQDLGGLDRWVVEASRSFAGSLGQTGADSRLQVAWLVAGLVALTSATAAFCRFLNEYISKLIATYVVRDLRDDLLARLVRFPMKRFLGKRLGDVVSRFSNDVQTTFLTVNIFVSEMMFQPFLLLGAVGIAFTLNWQLGLCALVSFPLVFLPVLLLGKRVNKRSRRTLSTLGEATESLNQVLSGMRVVRSYRMEDTEVDRYRQINAQWARKQAALARTKAKGKSVMDGIYGLLLAVILVGGSYLVVGERWGVTGSTLLSFVVALATMYRPIRRLSNAYNSWQMSLAASGRVFELLDGEVEAPDPPGAKTLGPISREVRFENVSFSYERGEQRVLRSVSFTIPAGSTVALVGPSGSGKSTVADLLFRFYEPDSGKITIDGVPLHQLSRDSLLGQIAVVSQQPFLFNATIRENIAYARPDASPSEVEEAARAAHIHDDVAALPRGYDTIVGERGARLSGGQLQRITIARAVLKRASMLLLDEATSSLDTEVERKVQEALDTLTRHKTALVIAHRLSTVVNADRILVMAAGTVVQQGTHRELMTQGGEYRRLFEAQAHT